MKPYSISVGFIHNNPVDGALVADKYILDIKQGSDDPFWSHAWKWKWKSIFIDKVEELKAQYVTCWTTIDTQGEKSSE